MAPSLSLRMRKLRMIENDSVKTDHTLRPAMLSLQELQ